MAKKIDASSQLPPEDFRSRRDYLPDDAFALVTGTYSASDLIRKDPWQGLMALPTDVLLRTSDNHGTQLAQLHGLWEAWVETLPIESDKTPFMFNAAWDAADDFNAVIFEAAHGYYRQGMANLRSALEGLAIAARFAVRQDATGLGKWLRGETEPNFGNARDMEGYSGRPVEVQADDC